MRIQENRGVEQLILRFLDAARNNHHYVALLDLQGVSEQTSRQTTGSIESETATKFT